MGSQNRVSWRLFRPLIFGVLCLGIAIATGQGAVWGQIYKYRDPSGAIRFTDDYSQVPADQRGASDYAADTQEPSADAQTTVGQDEMQYESSGTDVPDAAGGEDESAFTDDTEVSGEETSPDQYRDDTETSAGGDTEEATDSEDLWGDESSEKASIGSGKDQQSEGPLLEQKAQLEAEQKQLKAEFDSLQKERKRLQDLFEAMKNEKDRVKRTEYRAMVDNFNKRNLEYDERRKEFEAQRDAYYNLLRKASDL